MTGRLFFDTNVLVYAVDPTEPVKRARSVVLIQEAFASRRLVISPQTLNTTGVGPDQPIASNDTNDGRARNRRIEFRAGQ